MWAAQRMRGVPRLLVALACVVVMAARAARVPVACPNICSITPIPGDGTPVSPTHITARHVAAPLCPAVCPLLHTSHRLNKVAQSFSLVVCCCELLCESDRTLGEGAGGWARMLRRGMGRGGRADGARHDAQAGDALPAESPVRDAPRGRAVQA